MSVEEMMSLLRSIKEQLNTIEKRQIMTTKMVEHVEAEAAPIEVRGGFGSNDPGQT